MSFSSTSMGSLFNFNGDSIDSNEIPIDFDEILINFNEIHQSR